MQLPKLVSAGPPDAFEGGPRCEMESDLRTNLPEAPLRPSRLANLGPFAPLQEPILTQFIHQLIHHLHQLQLGVV